MKFDRSTMVLATVILLSGIALGYLSNAQNDLFSVTKEIKVTGNFQKMEVEASKEFLVSIPSWEGSRKQEGDLMIANEVFSVEISTATKKNHKYNLAASNDFGKGGVDLWTGNYVDGGDKVTLRTNNPEHPMIISYNVRDGKPYGKVYITIA